MNDEDRYCIAEIDNMSEGNVRRMSENQGIDWDDSNIRERLKINLRAAGKLIDETLYGETLDLYFPIAVYLDYPTVTSLSLVAKKFLTIVDNNVIWAEKFIRDFSHLNEKIYSELKKMINDNVVASKDIYFLGLVMDDRYNGEKFNYHSIIRNLSPFPELKKFFSGGEYACKIQRYTDWIIIKESPTLQDGIIYDISNCLANHTYFDRDSVRQAMKLTYSKIRTRITNSDVLGILEKQFIEADTLLANMRGPSIGKYKTLELLNSLFI